MSTREFTIYELTRTGSDYTDSGNKFVWTNEGRSSPRESWKFGVKLRTSRTDYPGSPVPVEQVLGHNYEPFSLSGLWDDRYNSAGFALGQQRQIEALVQRGGMVRIEFESIVIHGLITVVDFDYRREWQIGYTLTFSPHYRHKGSTGQLGPVVDPTKKGRGATTTPQEYRDRAVALAKQLIIAKNTFPIAQVDDGLSARMRAGINEILNSINGMTEAVNQRISPLIDTANGVKRIAGSFALIKGNAAALVFSLSAVRSDVALTWQSAVGVLSLESAARSMRTFAYALGLMSHEAALDLNRRVAPNAIAVYYPSRGESLYSIAQRFYGSASQWRLIATRNGLISTVLQGTEALIIPERR